ncbi:MAG: HD domain-containing protein [Phycisphaerales bacterium]|nr:HD domain-containing protein [Phycisphaerales bacterium]
MNKQNPYLQDAIKVIQDPVYGFITFDHPLIINILNHHSFQRLRRIRQLGLDDLVYPGVEHTRFNHSLGCYFLCKAAVIELQQKGIAITKEEELGVLLASLLHDIGHGPFGHDLESVIIRDTKHEVITLMIMHALNKEFHNQLDMAIAIFQNDYPKKFLHQLVSSQLDTDRLDYLTRDSYFSGVKGGIVEYNRILKMFNVVNYELVIEEKGLYSVENFLLARRQMYWQVYLHKTALAIGTILNLIIQRAQELYQKTQDNDLYIHSDIDFFLFHWHGQPHESILPRFYKIDDTDILFAIKKWRTYTKDFVLQELCRRLLDRDLLKIKNQNIPFDKEELQLKIKQVAQKFNISETDTETYFVITRKIENRFYKTGEEKINILLRSNQLIEINDIAHSVVKDSNSQKEQKYFLFFPEV